MDELSAAVAAASTEESKQLLARKRRRSLLPRYANAAAAHSGAKIQKQVASVCDLLDHFFRDISTAEANAGLFMLAQFHRYYYPRHKRAENDPHVLEDALVGVRYACAAYGWQLSALMAASSTLSTVTRNTDEANRRAFELCTGIPAKSIVCCCWDSHLFNPGHYIAVDDKRKAIVVAIRGTFHTRDALTDLVAMARPLHARFVMHESNLINSYCVALQTPTSSSLLMHSFYSSEVWLVPCITVS
eukprot:TRINITY_DN8842_c0_g1_i3.p1 TRINITY_DN8842_c0_g1~~TRINITY_DN8842_c0_g1_i3.p1  ORF type:complete len:245 (+),score=48.63 TRINITY_DN8842_c0_g1_i3:158-892(+)